VMTNAIILLDLFLVVIYVMCIDDNWSILVVVLLVAIDG
jgi:hypothetical protein